MIKTIYEDQVLQLDFLRHKVRLRMQEVELSPTEFRLLTVLAKNAGVVMSTERLLELVWGEAAVGDENVRVYISSLRKKLDGSPIQLIGTVREFGVLGVSGFGQFWVREIGVKKLLV